MTARASLPLSALAAAAVVAILRLLVLDVPPSPDEGGFLVVAQQWTEGDSLYGDKWVDRPPLLIALFLLADTLGGLVALRVIGILAAVASLLLLASTSGRVLGPRAATWTAVVAGGLLVSPLFGAVAVDGELLALPFVALGLRMTVEAVLAQGEYAARGAALVAGLSTSAALLVKQNFVDVLVFAAVAWLLASRRGLLSRRLLLQRTTIALGGLVAGYVLVMLFAMSRGTYPVEVFGATYQFRIHAAEVLASTQAQASLDRLGEMGLAFLFSGAPFVLVALAVVFRRTSVRWFAWGIVVLAAWVVVSILAGGNYWLHYLIQAVPPVALMAGVVAHVARRTAWVLGALMAVSGVVSLMVVVTHPVPRPGSVVGEAIKSSARPGDTLTSLFGQADINATAGLPSPYRFLWSLPAQARDTDMALLEQVLSGPEAPTWVVVRGAGTTGRLERGGAMPIIERRYDKVEEICSRRVYLRNDVERPPLQVTGDCEGLVLP